MRNQTTALRSCPHLVETAGGSTALSLYVIGEQVVSYSVVVENVVDVLSVFYEYSGAEH